MTNTSGPKRNQARSADTLAKACRLRSLRHGWLQPDLVQAPLVAPASSGRRQHQRSAAMRPEHLSASCLWCSRTCMLACASRADRLCACCCISCLTCRVHHLQKGSAATCTPSVKTLLTYPACASTGMCKANAGDASQTAVSMLQQQSCRKQYLHRPPRQLFHFV